MEKNQDELKAHLMATNEEFRSLAGRQACCSCAGQLDKIEAKAAYDLRKTKLRKCT